MLGRRKLIAAAAALVVVAGTLLALQGPHAPGQDSAAPAPSPAAADRKAMPAAEDGVVANAAGAAGTAAAAPAAPAGGDDEALPSLSGPSEDEVAREAQDDPHVTPAALIDFSHQVASVMIEARKNEALAAEAFSKLEQCATDNADQEVVQVRMVCLVNARELASRFPALAGRYETLARKSGDVASLALAAGL